MHQVRFPGESPEQRRARALRERVEDLRGARERIIAAADEERRRIQRDLHDGAQQRLVSLALILSMAESRLESEPARAAELIGQAREEAQQAIGELRELAGGIHPAVLSDHGLCAALEALASRAPVPVQVVGELDEKVRPAVEAAAYFVTSEALDQRRQVRRGQRGVRGARAGGRLPAPLRARRRRRRRRPGQRQRTARSARPRRRARRAARAATRRPAGHQPDRRDPGRSPAPRVGRSDAGRGPPRRRTPRRPAAGTRPRRTSVAPASPEPKTVARRRAEVELERLALAAAVERLAQDRQVGVLGRQAVAARRPARARVARLVDPHAPVGRDAVDVGDERDHVRAVGVGTGRRRSGTRSRTAGRARCRATTRRRRRSGRRRRGTAGTAARAAAARRRIRCTHSAISVSGGSSGR